MVEPSGGILCKSITIGGVQHLPCLTCDVNMMVVFSVLIVITANIVVVNICNTFIIVSILSIPTTLHG